jgi:hypothetical protein
MELDFDKEIDALLRKAAAGGTSASGPAVHLDAGDISAFAENALPDAAKKVFIAHFAECDRCRKILSQTILLNGEAEAEPSPLPAVAAAAPGPLPWYRRILAPAAAAYTMGALVLLFSGFLGYMVLQNMSGGRNADISQVANRPDAAQQPAETSATPAASNTAANAASTANANPFASNSAAPTPMPQRGSGANANAQVAAKDRPEIAVGTTAAPPPAPAIADNQPMAAPPPAPKTLAEDERANENRVAAAQTKEQALAREEQKLATTQRAKKAAPQSADSAFGAGRPDKQDMRAMDKAETDGTRRIAGRTFQKKQGVWYDAAYGGQATENVRRGSDAYKKLDGGLRGIAETLGGTVVVVWNSKAYRIQ